VTRIKICGVSDIESAVAAIRAGADFLGLVFAPSRRQVPVEKAQQIVKTVSQMEERPEIVGLFVNAPVKEVNEIAEYCNLTRVQLSGDETWRYCQEIVRPVIKVFHISSDSTGTGIATEIEKGYQSLSAQRLTCLLDSSVRGAYGGTGETFNWQIAKTLSARFPLVIAGGLTPHNVNRLINEIHPWGVDVSSGVETDGKKDKIKIKAFIEMVLKTDKENRGDGFCG
jgi:phosphoribosylanthranilate isomerase